MPNNFSLPGEASRAGTLSGQSDDHHKPSHDQASAMGKASFDARVKRIREQPTSRQKGLMRMIGWMEHEKITDNVAEYVLAWEQRERGRQGGLKAAKNRKAKP